MVDAGFIPPKELKMHFSLEPAYNALCSLILLTDDVPGHVEWVEQTIAKLSPEQIKANYRLVGMATLHLAGGKWPSFPAWVDDLAGRDPYTLCNQEIDHLIETAADCLGSDTHDLPAREQLINDRDLFLSLFERISECKEEVFDREWAEDTFAGLQDPSVRQAQMVDHLRTMWDEHLAAEWERSLPMLQDSIAAFESLDLSGLTTAEAIRRIIRRDEPDQWGHWRDHLDQIIFIPSPHIGPYLLLIDHTERTARVLFGARIPEGASVRSPALSRSDLVMRLDTLADDTRLRILELVALEGEQGAKEIMDRLDLSKSAASRHLRQLSAHGYLVMRTQDINKYYSLNPHRIDDTWQALRAFLRLP